MNPRVKLIKRDRDGDATQVFPETDIYSVIGLKKVIEELNKRIERLERKNG